MLYRHFETPRGTRSVCLLCAEAATKEGWSSWTEVNEDTLEGENPPCCDHCGTRDDTLWKLATEAVACYRSEFPGEGPDWESDWWVVAWEFDCGSLVVEFGDYLHACREVWGLKTTRSNHA